MSSVRRFRLAGAAGLVLAALTMAVTAVGGAAAAAPGSGPTTPRVDSSVPTSPTNAAKIFQWGSSAYEDEFLLPLSESWAVSDPDHVRNQNGMLTLEGTSNGQPVTATVIDHARRYGRWEARVRSDVRSAGGVPYRVVWELVPRPAEQCDQGITLATYSVDDHLATMDVRTPSARFTDSAPLDLGSYAWHTYAVEVTRDHVSWFIDTKVVMTERRPEVLSGVRYGMQFRLEPVAGARMDFTRMQMDWARYYTMRRPGVLPVDAPSADETVFASAC
jgi:hypothetical protein